MAESSRRRPRRVQPLFEPEGVYTHEQVMQALGIGPEAWRNACKRGLQHGQIARRLLLTGRQIAEFVELLGRQGVQAPAAAEQAGEAADDCLDSNEPE